MNACQTGPAHPHVAVDEADRQDPVAPDGRPLGGFIRRGCLPRVDEPLRDARVEAPADGIFANADRQREGPHLELLGRPFGIGTNNPCMNSPMRASSGSRASTWLLVGDNSPAVQPLVDALTARGHRHQIFGLPVSDADEEQLADALRAAAADDPTLRIVHVAALDADWTPSRAIDAVTVADATPNPGRNTAALPRRDCR